MDCGRGNALIFAIECVLNELAWRPRCYEARPLILIGSSVWIDYFDGIPAAHTEALDRLLVTEPSAIGDLILTEVLQSFDDGDDEHKLVQSLADMECPA